LQTQHGINLLKCKAENDNANANAITDSIGQLTSQAPNKTSGSVGAMMKYVTFGKIERNRQWQLPLPGW
jgi:hypothetical protein